MSAVTSIHGGKAGESTTHRWTDALLEPFRSVGDPVADPVVESIFANNEAAVVTRMLRSIAANEHLVPAEMPDAVENYLNQTDDWPAWADPEKVRIGQRLFGRYGMQMALALFTWSLPSCYACAKGAQVLTATGRIDKYVNHRIIETSQFLLDVMAEGGLERGGRGVRTAQKIRLLHATIRYHVRHYPKWQPEWGTPINQEDQAITLLTFALLPRTLTKLGLDFTPEEEDAFFHCWRVIGHILGIDAALLPRDPNEGQQLWDAITRRQVAPSEAGRTLTRALINYMKELVPGTMLDGLPAALIRELCDKPIAQAVLTEEPDWAHHLLGPMRVFFNLTDEAQDSSGIVARISGTFSRKLLEGLYSIKRGDKQLMFHIPQSLQDAWGLDTPATRHV
ncbi:DUF2236 domain-containing protein [Cystobacter fuscus]|nr:DUF2236 domain-containing protein [Cystobacter fuscus]